MMERRKDKNKKLTETIEKGKKNDRRKQVAKKIFKVLGIFILILVLMLSYMHYIGTSGLNVREYRVSNKDLPENMHGLKIVHFSDLNFLSTVSEKDVKKLVNEINRIKPDIVVFTGNLVAKKKILEKSESKFLVKQLNRIEATVGKYAIKGSNDYNQQYSVIIDQTDFKLIKNSYEFVYYHGNTPIMLVGSESMLKGKDDLGQAFSYNQEEEFYTITLIHEPDLANKIINKYKTNLILAGHSLNGQIRLPGVGGLIKFNGARKYYNESYDFKSTQLYISGGIGTNGSKLRFFNRPSINFYRIVKEA